MIKRLIAAALLLFLAGCAGSQPIPTTAEALVTVNGEAVPDAEVILSLRMTMESAGAYGSYVIDWDGDIDGESSRDYIRRQAQALIAERRAISAQAESLGLGLTDAELAEINSRVAQEAEFSGGSEAFDEWVSSNYGPMELYKLYMHEAPYLADKLSAFLFSAGGQYEPSAEDLEKYYAENYTNCAYILLSALDEDGRPLEGDELETMRDVSEALRKQAVDGADFLRLVAEHGQDYVMAIYPEGHPIAKGLHGEEFDKALAELPVGGISDVVATGDAFFVIKRLPVQEDYPDQNYDELYDAYVTEKFRELIHEWSYELAVSASMAYNELDPALYEPGVG